MGLEGLGGCLGSVQPLGCGTRGRRCANDAVMRAEGAELCRGLTTMLSSPVANLLGTEAGRGLQDVSAHST